MGVIVRKTHGSRTSAGCKLVCLRVQCLVHCFAHDVHFVAASIGFHACDRNFMPIRNRNEM